MPVFTQTFQLLKDRRAWFVLLIGLALLALALAPLPLLSVTPQERYFHIQASSFDYTPSVLRVNPGDRVTIELDSTDVVHGIYIDGYDLEVHADPGQPARLSFVANQPGSFRFRCSITCGSLHPFMIGKLKVGANWFYWRALGGAIVVALAGFWMVRR